MITRRSFAAAASAALVAALAAGVGGCGSGETASPGQLTDADQKAQDAMRDMMTKKAASRKGRTTRR